MDSISPPGSEAFLIARSILSTGILALRALSMAVRKAGEFTSPFTLLASIEIKRTSLEKSLPLLASVTAFLRFICTHLLCPAIIFTITFLEQPRVERYRGDYKP